MLPADTLTEVAGPAMRGTVVRPDDAAYEGLRRVQNAMIDRRPALIAQVADAGDVAAALAHARTQGLPVSVRGGGHAATGHAIAAGGVVIDTRALKGVHVRVASRTVTVGAGVSWGELDAATQEHGLAITGARVPSVGVVGFTTGSGSGWLERVMGLAADNLLSARVVAADGREVTTSEHEHPELFWALRGGGGNFGVVTELTFGAMPLGPTVLAGMRLYPLDRVQEIVTAYRGVIDDAPEALCGGLAMLTAPPAPHIPPELHGRPVIAVIALWAGDPEDAWSGVERLDVLGRPLADLVQPVPYATFQGMFGPRPGQSPPMRGYQRFGLLDALTDPAIEAVTALAEELPSAQSAVMLHPLGGAFGRTPEGATALGGRGATWAYQLLTTWPDARDDAPNVAWTRAAAAEMADHAHCAPYPNFISDDDRRRLAVPYAPPTLARLREVKRMWDPENVFRSCHNIAPAD